MTSSTNALLAISDLSKYYRHPWTYRKIRILEAIDFEVRDGECFGLIGPNGAGKTTTFKCILGFLRPSTGIVQFQGQNLTAAARSEIGFLPEQPYFYDHLTVEETLTFFATLYGMNASERRSRVNEIIEKLELVPKRNAALRTLSKGTLQRVGIAQAILNRPKLAILDEPMSGLDPGRRRHMRELILELRNSGTSILLSTHILSDAEVLCDRVAILVGGRIREVIEVGDQSTESTNFALTIRGANAAASSALEGVAVSPPERSHGDLTVFRLRDPSRVRTALELVQQLNLRIESLVPIRTSIEECFLKHVGDSHQID